MRCTRRLVRLGAMSAVGAMVVGSAHGAVTQIGIGDFSGNETVESFENYEPGPNVGIANVYLVPGNVSAFSFATGVTLTAPIPNGGTVKLGDFTFDSGAIWGLSSNGTVSSSADVPDGSAYIGLDAGMATFELTFDAPQIRVGALVSAALFGATLDGITTFEAFDEMGASLGSVSIAGVPVADWGTNFLGIEDPAGIKRIVVSGPFVALDELRFETLPSVVWNEVADAGQNGIANAQLTWSVEAALKEIRGNLSDGDVDLYCIKIVDEANFSASTLGGTTIDTLLYLFDVDGNGIAFNDQAGTNQSTINSTLVSSNGTYFLAVCAWPNQRPLDEQDSLIFPDVPISGQVPPHPCGGGNRPNCNSISGRLGSWTSGAGTTGDYTIFLEGAEFCASRCPTTLHVPSSFPTIGDAIAASVSGDTILVAPGTYMLGGALNPGGRQITLRSEAGPENTSIVNPAGRAFFIGGNIGPRCRIEGFTITGMGTVLGVGAFITNRAAPQFIDCRFIDCQTTADASAAYMQSRAAPIFDRCVFRNCQSNTATVMVNGPDVTSRFSNCLLDSNMANGWPGLTLDVGPTVEVFNSTFVNNNSGVGGGGIAVRFSAAVLSGANNVVFGNTPTDFSSVVPNTVFTYSLFPGGTGTNIPGPPKFLDPDDGDYRLGAGSPGIDAGSCSLLPPDGTARDLDGRPRLLDAVSIIDMGPTCNGMGPVDMGCYESNSGVKGDCPGDANGDGAVDFGDITTVLGNWLAICP